MGKYSFSFTPFSTFIAMNTSYKTRVGEAYANKLTLSELQSHCLELIELDSKLI